MCIRCLVPGVWYMVFSTRYLAGWLLLCRVGVDLIQFIEGEADIAV